MSNQSAIHLRAVEDKSVSHKFNFQPFFVALKEITNLSIVNTKQLFTSVSVKVVDIYLNYGELLLSAINTSVIIILLLLW